MPSSGPDDALTPIDQAILGGEQKYTAPIRVPILAIFAVPHNLSDLFNDNPKAEAAAEAVDMEQTSAQIRAFERATRRHGFFDWRTRTTTFSYRIKQTY
jgi:hypothetical protein